MRERSPYEGTFDRTNGRVCLGLVTQVNPTERTVKVTTLGSQDFGTDDRPVDAKIGHIAWHPNGTYGLYIPQVGEYVLIEFLNSEAFVICSYPLSNAEGPQGRDNQFDDLLPGDWGFITFFGSKIIVRAGGTVEIETSPGCRTRWLKQRQTINSICSNFELEPSGGLMHWTINPQTQDTVLRVKAYDNLEVENALDVNIGAADADGNILNLKVGPVGEQLNVDQPNLTLTISPEGQTNLNIKENVKLSLAPDGNASLELAKSLNIKAAESTVVDAATNQVYKSPKTAIGNGSIELLEEISNAIDALGELEILTRVGLAAPVKMSPQWQQMIEIQNKIKTITGSF